MNELIRCLKHEIKKGNFEVALNYFNAVSEENPDENLGRMSFLFSKLDREIKESRTYREMRKLAEKIKQ